MTGPQVLTHCLYSSVASPNARFRIKSKSSGPIVFRRSAYCWRLKSCPATISIGLAFRGCGIFDLHKRYAVLRQDFLAQLLAHLALPKQPRLKPHLPLAPGLG